MMAEGIYIGKCSPASMSKVPTFCTCGEFYYYCSLNPKIRNRLHRDYSIGADINDMKHASPVILAFWSDEE